MRLFVTTRMRGGHDGDGDDGEYDDEDEDFHDHDDDDDLPSWFPFPRSKE